MNRHAFRHQRVSSHLEGELGRRQVIAVSKIDNRFRIYVPAAVMKKMQLRRQDRLVFIEDDETVIVEPSYAARYREG